MHKILSLLFLFISSNYQLEAQTFPHEGSILNYRLIGFSFPAVKNAHNYTLEIATGNYNTEDSFKKNILVSRTIDTNRVLAEVPAFGQQYTWRIIPGTNNSIKVKTNLNHFSTGTIPATDNTITRLKITKAATKYKNALVFMDASSVLYDMKGQPIWYLPVDRGFLVNNIRDLKLSPYGTITFMNDTKIYEINYNGDILFQKPDSSHTGKRSEALSKPYHHEFTRFANGHYMVLGTENVLCKLPSSTDSNFVVIDDENIKRDSNSVYKKMPFETIEEYDADGKLIWLWRTSKYFEQSDLSNLYIPDSKIDMHENAFYFDKQNNTIYISFRNISRIITVKYPEGIVSNTYGQIFRKGIKYQNGISDKGNEFFCAQHACKRSQKGYLYLFDNGCDAHTTPKVVMLKESSNQKNNLKKIWEFECKTSASDKYPGFDPGSGGGNVIELPDQSIFVEMGTLLGKVFIVNLNKEILWSAISEAWDQDSKKWKMISAYRASIITDPKDLEQLIWNSEMK